MSDHNAKLPRQPEVDTHLHPPSDEALHRKRPLRAIPTSYAGCEFRSRLEARWAVFFDALAIEWEYEEEGFILAPFGDWYLPDFHLPELGYWIEVKPELPDEEEQRKTYLFHYSLAHAEDPVKSRERAFVLYGGIPWPHPTQGNLIGYSASHEVEGDPSRKGLCWQLCPKCQQPMIGKINTFACCDCRDELGLVVEDALDAVEDIPVFDKVVDIVPAMVSAAVGTEFFTSGHKMPTLQEAYGKARAARFEKGTPPPSRGLKDAS